MNGPKTIIDDSDKDLFELAKTEADENFNGEFTESLIIMLIKKNKNIRFTHDFEEETLYIDFPDRK